LDSFRVHGRPKAPEGLRNHVLHPARHILTEMNRIRVVLFKTNNRICGPHLTAIDRISVMYIDYGNDAGGPRVRARACLSELPPMHACQ
jgi:hypothetical protein